MVVLLAAGCSFSFLLGPISPLSFMPEYTVKIGRHWTFGRICSSWKLRKADDPSGALLTYSVEHYWANIRWAIGLSLTLQRSPIHWCTSEYDMVYVGLWTDGYVIICKALYKIKSIQNYLIRNQRKIKQWRSNKFMHLETKIQLILVTKN